MPSGKAFPLRLQVNKPTRSSCAGRWLSSNGLSIVSPVFAAINGREGLRLFQMRPTPLLRPSAGDLSSKMTKDIARIQSLAIGGVYGPFGHTSVGVIAAPCAEAYRDGVAGNIQLKSIASQIKIQNAAVCKYI